MSRLAALHLTLLLGAPLGAQQPDRTPSDTLTLVEAARAALGTDPLLHARQAGADAASSNAGAARAGLFPQLSAAASMVRFGEPMVVAPLHGFDPRTPPEFDQTLAQGRVTLGYTVFDGGATRARFDAARAVDAAARAGIQDTEGSVLESLAETYLGALTARDVLAAELERVRALESERDRAARLLAEGSVPRLELLRAEAELGSARAGAATADSRVRLAEARLALLTSLPETEVRDAELLDLSPPLSLSSSDTLATPPSVEAALERVEAARAAVREAHAAYLPRVSALGLLQEFGGGATSFSTEWQGGLQVEYPLFNGGRRRHALERSRAELNQALAESDLADRRVEEATLAAEAARRESEARMVALEDAMERFEELVRVEELALAEGAGVQTDFLSAQAGLLNARAGYAEARRAALMAEVRRARALGSLTLQWIENLTEEGP